MPWELAGVLSHRGQHLGWVAESLNSASRTITMRSLQRGTDGMGAWCPHSQPHDSEEFFFRLHSTTQTLTTHAYSHPYEHTYANPTPMSISKTEPANPRD